MIDFEREVERHRPEIYKAALRLTRDVDDAEDLTQDALVRAQRAYATFDGGNFRAWVVRIVGNLFINDYKARQRHPVVYMDARVAERVYDDEANDAAACLVAEELGDEVWTALKTIPTIFARPVLMIDVAGVSYDAFALAEGIPVGTVRSRLSRGRVQLRKLLAAYAESQGYFR